MKQKSIIILAAGLLLAAIFVRNTQVPNYDIGSMTPIIDRMPLILDDPFASKASQTMPQAERGPEVQKWIEPGVRVHVTGALGSGTIVYFNEQDGYAYVQSCGHLWDGNMSAEEGKRRNITCKVVVFYQNGQRLTQTKDYPAEVLFYSNNKSNGGHLCQDVSLLKFKPDFQPKYFPVAPNNYVIQENQKLHSIGCDHGTEVAHYSVRAIGERGGQWPDLVTTENSPRPGRSGGGLICDDALYVGICWGTSDYSGNGNGYFTPLKTIRYFNEINGFGWINDVRSAESIARKLPIVDRNNPQQKYPKDYIPLPRK